jgi:signal transduction histidine kinase
MNSQLKELYRPGRNESPGFGDERLPFVGDPGALLYAYTTEKSRAEEIQRQLRHRLEEAAEEWQKTFDASEAPIFVFTPARNLKRLNRAALDLLGGIYQDHLGKPLEELGSAPFWIELARLVAAVQEGEGSCHAHCTDPALGRTWTLTANLIPAQEIGSERILVVAKDVTSLLALQASLRNNELMAAMGTLVAGVAHEVRSSLFGLSSGLESLVRRLESQAAIEPALLALHNHLDRLKGLTRELLEYGKPCHPSLAPQPLARLVGEAMDACAPLAEHLGVQVRLEVPADLPLVRVDAERLQATFRNLIENAVQHSPTCGAVVIRAQRFDWAGKPALRCIVEDHGKGFPEDQLEQVFEPFFSRRCGGTGLGLSIVKKVIEGHGGRVVARNAAHGGAEVVVDLLCGTDSLRPI